MNLLIYQNNGNLLYSYSDKNDNNFEDNHLFAAFMSAVQTFSSTLTGEDFKALKISKTSYIFKKSKIYEIIYAISSDKKKRNQLEKELNQIIQVFEKKYDSSISDWNGELNIFNDFDEYFSHSVTDSFKQAFW